MTREADQLDKQILEEALRDALKSVLGSAGPRVNPRVEFYNKFQREMEEHDRDFEKKYDEDLNTTLIFSGLFSAVTSAFIIGVQSELKPDYEEMNNTLLEMLFNATTGNLPTGAGTSLPRWSGPDPVTVQVQCILYATLSATLLASLLAMLGKQWLNRYRQGESRGSAADRSRVHERGLSGIEIWKFRVVMESLPLILKCAMALLGFALSRYLWQVNRSVSSVVIGFTSFGFLFYLFIVTVSIFSPDRPPQTPFALLVRFVIGSAVPYWRSLRQTLRRGGQPLQSGAQHDIPLSMNTGHGLEASITALACIAPAVVQFPWSVTPLFNQGAGTESDRLDARCIGRMFARSSDLGVVTSIMDFIPEIVWHSGIKNVPLRRIYAILMDCFDFSGPRPVMIHKLRDVAYLSARAFAHIGLQRRCITQYKEHEQDSWKATCANHRLLSPADHGPDSDLETALFMVDMTLGYGGDFPWAKTQMTPPHRAWMSHVFLYRAWHEKQVLEAVMDFVENSMSLRPPSDVVIADCLFIIGLMIGVPVHVSDITVRDKSREKIPALRKIFRVLSTIFSSESVQMPLALRALRLVTQLAVADVSDASYELFKMVMASDSLTDQHWEATRLAIGGAFDIGAELRRPIAGELRDVLKFLDYHLDLQGAGKNHELSIVSAMEAIIASSDNCQADSLTVEYIRNSNGTSPSFANGMRLMMDPSNTSRLRMVSIGLISLTSDQWFGLPVPAEEMSKFCEHLAVFMIDDALHREFVRKFGATILFEMLCSPAWRKHIVTRFWSMFVYCTEVPEGRESLKWCLRNAVELLEFTRGLPDGEGLKWWYGTLWFHYDKLDATVRSEVERIARDMSLGRGLSDLNLYLNLIEQDIARTRQAVDELASESGLAGFGMELRARLIALEGNYLRLARITGRCQ